MNKHARVLNIVRGLVASIFCGLGGAAICGLIIGMGAACRFLLVESEWNKGFLDYALDVDFGRPILACTTTCACAGWATYGPRGNWRFAPSLFKVFWISLLLWFFWGLFSPLQKVQDPYSADNLTVIIAGPVVAAWLLTMVRIRGDRARRSMGNTQTIAQ